MKQRDADWTESIHFSRRKLFAGAGALATTGLAGCINNNDDDPRDSPVETGSPTELKVTEQIYVDADADGGGNGSEEAPFASIRAARDHLRDIDLSTIEGSVAVEISAGTYRISEPLSFEPNDTGTASKAIIYRGPSEGTARISGGITVDGWSETTVNDVTAWEADVSDKGSFKQLFIDGERRPRPRLPKSINRTLVDNEILNSEEDVFSVLNAPSESSATSMTVPAEAVDPSWQNMADIEVNAMKKWYDERMPVQSITVDGDEATLTVSRRASWNNLKDRRFYLENVFEALSEPGEWYLDSATETVYYIPKEGETPDSVTVTVTGENSPTRLLSVVGDPTNDAHVRNLHFENLTFAYAGWKWAPYGSIQSASTVPGSVHFRGAIDCSLHRCTVEHVGHYGVEVTMGSENVEITSNELRDLGGGGVRLNGATSPEGADWSIQSTDPAEYTRQIRVTDNHIHNVGRVFHRSVGVLAQHVSQCAISHNEIHDCFYSGVSCGWTWDNVESSEQQNLIAYNYIYNLMHGLLADGGGVYTLAEQPGTTVQNNYIHDIHQWVGHKNGAGLYPDEGSRYIHWRDNVVHNTHYGFHMHWGEDNLVTNNILAHARYSLIEHSKHLTESPEITESDTSLTVQNNVLASNGSVIYTGDRRDVDGPGLVSDNNLLHNSEGDLSFGSGSGLGLPGDINNVYGYHIGSEDWAGKIQNLLDFKYQADGDSVQWVTTITEKGINNDGEPKNSWPKEGEPNFMGFQFTTGDDPILVTHLGRYIISGNNQSHTLKILNRDANEEVVQAALDTTSLDSDAFGYVELEEPLELAPNTRYLLVGQEFGGGDMFYQVNSVETSSVASIDGAVWRKHWKNPIIPSLSLERWREAGFDTNSVVADPMFFDSANGDFTLGEDSPAYNSPVNFEPIDLSTVGPREDGSPLSWPIETTPPTTEHELDPGLPNDKVYDGGTTVTATLTASDEDSGLEQLEYQLDGSAWTDYETPLEISGDGEHTIRYRAVDQAGNVSEVSSVTFSIGSGPNSNGGSIEYDYNTFTNADGSFDGTEDNEPPFTINTYGAISNASNENFLDRYSAIYLDDQLGESGTITTKISSIGRTGWRERYGIIVRNDITDAGGDMSDASSTPPEGGSAGYVIFSLRRPQSFGATEDFRLYADEDGDGWISTGPMLGKADSFPYWLRLEKVETTFTASYSADGSSWKEVGSVTVDSAAPTQDVGMVATSTDPETLSENNVFEEFSVTR